MEPALVINTDGSDGREYALAELADQLRLAGADVSVGSVPLEVPLKGGAEIIVSLGLSAATLRSLGHIVSPIITSWINRPRDYKVTIIAGTGKSRREVQFAESGVDARKFSAGLQQVAEIMADMAVPDADEGSRESSP